MKSKTSKDFDSLRAFISEITSLSTTEEDRYLVWTAGCTEWLKLSSVSKIIKNGIILPPPIPRDIEEVSIRPTTLSNPSPQPEVLTKIQTPRKHTRHEVRLKVIISNKEKTFLSYSKNVSVGGLLLEDRIPSYMFNEDSEVFISGPQRKEIIAFKCKPIGDQDNPNRVKFDSSSEEHLAKLKAWISVVEGS